MKNEMITDMKLSLLEDYDFYLKKHQETQREINKQDHAKWLATTKGNDDLALALTNSLTQLRKDFAYQSGMIDGIYYAVQIINHLAEGSDDE